MSALSTFFSFAKTIMGPSFTKTIRPTFHGIKGYLAAIRYGFPAKKLIIIGINGTKGKTTTTVYLGRMMNLANLKTGYLSTAILCVPGPDQSFDQTKSEKLNPFKMTAIDAFQMQKRLRQMVGNGCQYAVIEMSSEGLAQNRHWGLFGFPITIFLNAYPEHLEAHGGWDNYLKCKSKLFKSIKINGTFVGNNSELQLINTNKMLAAMPSPNTINKIMIDPSQDFEVIKNPGKLFLDISINEQTITTPALAKFELDNFYFAYRTLQSINSTKAEAVLDPNVIAKVMKGVPGRMEWVVVDNAVQK